MTIRFDKILAISVLLAAAPNVTSLEDPCPSPDPEICTLFSEYLDQGDVWLDLRNEVGIPERPSGHGEIIASIEPDINHRNGEEFLLFPGDRPTAFSSRADFETRTRYITFEGGTLMAQVAHLHRQGGLRLASDILPLLKFRVRYTTFDDCPAAQQAHDMLWSMDFPLTYGQSTGAKIYLHATTFRLLKTDWDYSILEATTHDREHPLAMTIVEASELLKSCWQ